METLLLLIPVSFIALGGIVAALVWAIASGQYEDLSGPEQRLLHEPDFLTDPDPAEDHGPQDTPRP